MDKEMYFMTCGVVFSPEQRQDDFQQTVVFCWGHWLNWNMYFECQTYRQ